MKKLVVILLALLANSSIGVPDPIVGFPEGHYLGLGYFGTNAGDKGEYSTYADIHPDWWKVSHYMEDGGLFSFNAYFSFDENGFFDVALEDEYGDYHYGSGYCRSVQCHYAIDLGDRIIEETLSFVTWQNTLYVVGSMRPHGEQDDHFAVSWEATLAQLD